MKAIRIEFIPDTRWRWVWVIAVLLVAGGLAWFGLRWQHSFALRQEQDARIDLLGQQVRQLNIPRAVAADPRQLSAEQAAKLLQQDLNKVFTSAENMKEPNVRLRNLSLDSGANLLRLEFEVDSLARASSVTAVLNAGYESHPWKLQSVTAGGGGPSMPSMFGAQAFKGLWVAQTDKL